MKIRILRKYINQICRLKCRKNARLKAKIEKKHHQDLQAGILIKAFSDLYKKKIQAMKIQRKW